MFNQSQHQSVTYIQCDYIEISQFETDTSSYKVGGRRMKRVEQGICCFANTSKTSYAYCEAGKPVRFVKIQIGKDYFDSFLKVRYGDSYDHSRNAMDYLSRNPNLPELNYIFRQKDCRAIGTARQIYLESKVMEILSFVTHHYQEGQNKKHISVKLDRRDIRSLGKTVTYMKNNVSAYPSTDELAKIAGMSSSRYGLAFRQVYGTAPYEYLKELRMNQALLLLNDFDYNVQTIADKVGYTNAGHFSGLFKKTGVNKVSCKWNNPPMNC